MEGGNGMSARVLSTGEARSAIVAMQSIISSGLTGQLQALNAQGNRLSDANVWDGMEAVRFRSDLWPQITKALHQAVEALTELQTYIAQVNQNIMAAGGNG
jgi:hypothetical protein